MMTEVHGAPEGLDVPDIGAELQRLGVGFMMGADIHRTWVTGVQAFVTPVFATVIFREQMVGQSVTGKTETVLKNVASVVMPTEVLREFHAIIGQQLEELDAGGQ